MTRKRMRSFANRPMTTGSSLGSSLRASWWFALCIAMPAGFPVTTPRASAGGVGSPPRVTARIEQGPARRDGSVVLIVQVTSDGVALGSYQGSVHFDPSVFVADSVVAGGDGYRVANGHEVARGVVRFAGFTTAGFRSIEAVRIVGVTKQSLDRARFSAELDIAGDLEGKKISPKYLRSTNGVTYRTRR